MDSDYIIEMLHITKEFPGIVANDDITLQLRRGEIHALLGENGAGKSTLMSVLFGLYQPEAGVIKKNGEVVRIDDPNDATALGIGMSALDVAGQQLTSLTAYNEYITSVIIAVIVYLSAFSLVIKMWISGGRKPRHGKAAKEDAAVESASELGSSAVTPPVPEPADETPPAEAVPEKGGEE